MTPVELAFTIRFRTGTDDGELIDSDILTLANIAKDDIAKEIAKRNEDYFGMRFYRDLVADRRAYGIPDDVLNNLKYLEAKLNGTDFKHLTEFDLNSYKRPTDEASILSNFTDDNPKYDIFNRTLNLYTGSAIEAVTEGLVLHAIIYPADIANLTRTVDMAVDPTEYSAGFPRQFHDLLATKVSIEYKSNPHINLKLSEKELTYKEDLEFALDAITGMNLDNSIIATVPSNDGQNY